ncbi:glutaredoxin [Sphingomonas sp. IC-56]|uniref:glutaredoxin family protein n=1 Tax=Sphingomonas sp. IC-56 TaxID=2898529 RepID=UPI001E4AFC39|nr:glutaredoxin [Sphingomonas sp. IC-56]MCD2324475.1 glutaredoxin [Sphingomonas sp. IC-56]
MTDQQSATLHRMVLSDHVCPFGVRAKELLEANGFQVDDRHLTTREQVEDFKAEHGIRTTPLIFIGEERIGGCDDLERHLQG